MIQHDTAVLHQCTLITFACIPGIGHINFNKSSIYSVESQLDHVDHI